MKKAYESLEFKEWDGKTPLMSYNTEEYFFDEENYSIKEKIVDYYSDRDLPINDLVICQPFVNPVLHDDFFLDDVYLDDICELPDAYKEAIDTFNKTIASLEPFAWEQSRFRTTIDFTKIVEG